MLTFSRMCGTRLPVDSVANAAFIKEHILAFKCWLRTDSRSASYANESSVTGVIRCRWLFRGLMVQHNEPTLRAAAWRKVHADRGRERDPAHKEPQRQSPLYWWRSTTGQTLGGEAPARSSKARPAGSKTRLTYWPESRNRSQCDMLIRC